MFFGETFHASVFVGFVCSQVVAHNWLLRPVNYSVEPVKHGKFCSREERIQ
jgi:hypothetical protein